MQVWREKAAVRGDSQQVSHGNTNGTPDLIPAGVGSDLVPGKCGFLACFLQHGFWNTSPDMKATPLVFGITFLFIQTGREKFLFSVV